MIVKTLLYCTRKSASNVASCMRPPPNVSTGQVLLLEHETFQERLGMSTEVRWWSQFQIIFNWRIYNFPGRYTGSRINSGPLARSSNSEPDFNNGHISRFCFVFQVIQVITSEMICTAEEVDRSFISITKPLIGSPQISKPCFWKRDSENGFHKCHNSGINESTPQTQSNVSWKSSNPELEISLLKSRC